MTLTGHKFKAEAGTFTQVAASQSVQYDTKQLDGLVNTLNALGITNIAAMIEGCKKPTNRAGYTRFERSRD